MLVNYKNTRKFYKNSLKYIYNYTNGEAYGKYTRDGNNF